MEKKPMATLKNPMKTPVRCLVLGPVRGDPVLFSTLLTKVAQVAHMVKEQLTWTAVDAVVVLNGDWLDRFSPEESKRWLTLQDAIRDYRKIMHMITTLRPQAQQKGSDLICMVGDHELNQLVQNPNYIPCAVPVPSVENLKVWQTFLENELKPFLREHSSIVVSWDRFFISHGAISANWLARNQFTSIPQVNQAWQQALLKPSLLQKFREAESPINNHQLSEAPQAWLENNSIQVGDILGDNAAINYFIVSDTPIVETSYDILLKPWKQKGSQLPLLYSTGFVSKPQLFLLNNQAADVYREMKDRDLRQPIALEFSGTFHGEQERLLRPQVQVIHLSPDQIDQYFQVTESYGW